MIPVSDPPAPPAWFQDAVSRAPRRSVVAAAGGEIELLVWGEGDAPGILFLHGNAAHADWWSFIAPSFATGRPVAAMSWSGMGGSSWRPAYDYETYAQEALAVIEAAGLARDGRAPIVVAHSFGGFPAMHLAAAHASQVAGLILIDVFVRPPGVDMPPWTQRPMKAAAYPTLEAGLARFGYRPAQSAPLDYINDWIARRSLRRLGDGSGWTWKVDPDFAVKVRRDDPRRLLADVDRPIALIAGGASANLTPPMIDYMRSLRPDLDVAVIPGAGHHIMVDHPLELIDAIQGAVARIKARAWPDRHPAHQDASVQGKRS